MSEGPIRVLVIEGNPPCTAMIRKLLQEENISGFDIDSVEDVRSVIEQLDENGVDVLLLNCEQVGPDEIDNIDELRTNVPRIPVIVLTGKSSEQVINAVRKGAKDYLLRGELTAGQLTCTLENAVARNIVDMEILDAKEDGDLYLDLMSHDIDNKNVIALLAAEILIDEMDLDDVHREYLQKIINSIISSSTIISNIKKLRKVEHEKLKVYSMDLDSVLEEIAEESRKNPVKKVSIDYLKSGVRVTANELLVEVFSNLLDNAIKYSGETVKIKVRVRKCDDGIEIAVEDSGKGVSDKLKKVIFMPDIRGKESVKGSGLGLYLSKTLIEKYGGSIRIEDKVTGDSTQGARFVVVLPQG